MIAVPMKVAVQSAIPFSIEAQYVSGGAEKYQGEYEFTPSDEEQIVQTKNKILLENVVIHKIPSNYGRVSWNGSVLTIT